MTHGRITIGRTSLDRVTLIDALDRIERMVTERRGGFVVTPNVDHLVMIERDARIRGIYERARLSLADGQPLIWMSRLLGTPLPEKVSGSDLIEPLMARAATRGWNVYFVGATPAVSAEADRRLRQRYPDLRIVGRDTTAWVPDRQTKIGVPDVVGSIRRVRADLVLVALGSPKQEQWMARYEHLIAPAVAIGVGASLDFVAGAVRRAPAWMSRAGLEWAYRLAQEPRRLAYRYLVRDTLILPIFAAALARAGTVRLQAAFQRS